MLLHLNVSRRIARESSPPFIVCNLWWLGTNERLGCTNYFRSAFPQGLFACNYQGLCTLFRYAMKPTLCFGFIAPLLDGIGSHDCTPLRKSTVAPFRCHYSIAFISSPRFDNLDTKHLLLQFGFAYCLRTPSL